MGSGDRRNKRRYDGKRKFRGNQHTSSQRSSKKSREENNPANVPASCSKLDNLLLFDKSYNFEKINGDCSSTECYLFVNSVNILNLMDLIGKCPEVQFKYHVIIKYKNEKRIMSSISN